jgi:hyperosmotically inducible periplasmic protein
MKTALLVLIPFAVFAAQNQPAAANPYLAREVARELAKLYASIFDDISYRVDGYNLTLIGEVRRPLLKQQAERLARRIEGAEQVINQIEVLPLSPNDEAIRHATYPALVRQPTLRSYFQPNASSILIIVKNGNVTVKGAVSNQADANLARLASGRCRESSA